jgi:hypothetical protein
VKKTNSARNSSVKSKQKGSSSRRGDDILQQLSASTSETYQTATCEGGGMIK